jgi:hypothetical protein
MSGWLAFFLTFHTIVQRRLEYLETLPEDYDATPSRSSPQPGPVQPKWSFSVAGADFVLSTN